MKKWVQKEIDFLKENYEKTLNKELVKILNRNIGSINYMAMKLGLKKDYNFLCHSKKKLKKELTNFGVKKNKAGKERMESLSGHDDLVMALAMANEAAQNLGSLPFAVLQ